MRTIASTLRRGNYWSDYTGEDRNQDGIGDTPYHQTDVFGYIVDRHPDARILALSPALALMRKGEEMMPLLDTEGGDGSRAVDAPVFKMSAYLEITNLTKRYGATCALDGVNLTIERGSTLALLGPNGAGKSTLFGCLLGLTAPTCGEILLEGRPVADADRNSFGYVAERVALYPQRTVGENAAFFARLKGLPVAEAERQINRVGMQLVGGRKVRHLSKGHAATPRAGHRPLRPAGVARARRTF